MPVPLRADDRLLLFPGEPFDWVAEEMPVGTGRALSFRGTVAVSDPEQLARALGSEYLGTLTAHELAERLAAEPAVQAGVERAWDAPDDSLPIRLRAALAAPLLTTWGLSLVALADERRHEAPPVELPEPQRPLLVAADGSGDFRTLDEAVAAARPARRSSCWPAPTGWPSR